MKVEKLSIFQRVNDGGFPRLISDLLNPLFVQPLVIIIVAWQLNAGLTAMAWIAIAALIFYTAIPLAGSVYLLSINEIASLDIPERRSRNEMFLLSIGSSGIAELYYRFFIPASHTFIADIALIFFINAIIGYVINLYWKISMHSAALASAGTIFLFAEPIYSTLSIFGTDIFSLIILLLLLPWMIWSRYRLAIHSLPELVVGSISGFALTFIELIILTAI